MSEKDRPSSETPVNVRVINKATIRITPSEPFRPSRERVNAERFGNDLADIESSIRVLCEWINLPTLQDTFESHTERRAWENNLDQETQRWLDENKIGGNQWGYVHLQFGILKRLVVSHEPELAEEIGRLTQGVGDILRRLKDYKDEGLAAREAYLEAIRDLDTMARAVVSAVTR